MNYLAHAYLSFGHSDVLVGNLISDFVKGKKKFDYPVAVQWGIQLHRAIDIYTDAHADTRAGKQFFKTAAGAYAGAFMDVVYDHFLAADPIHWEAQALSHFAQDVYRTLHERAHELPERFRQMLPYMSSQNWLFHYQHREGIEKSFMGVTRRAVYLDDSAPAYAAFLDHYDRLEPLAASFLHDVKKFAAAQFAQLVS